MGDGSACDSSNDNCFVHVNATITGHARYLVTNAIGRDLAQKLYYFVLVHRLNQGSDIVDEAKQTMSACGSVDGLTTDLCNQVAQAYAQVGITQ